MILVSCSQTQKEGVALPETAEKKEMIAGKPAASYVAPTNEFSIDRKLIKEGFITMEVKNLQNSRSEIKKLTTEFNAYISNESQSENETRNEANFTIRIPFNSYEKVCEAIITKGVKIDVSNLTAVDTACKLSVNIDKSSVGACDFFSDVNGVQIFRDVSTNQSCCMA